jgi:DNA-directed RNA polymerase subunit M/transcription elongation factor TFIIS
MFHDVEANKLTRVCRNCGHQEEEGTGGLIVEKLVQEKSSEGYKVLLNEFTRLDNTYPHTKMLKCPNGARGSNGGAERDVIYLKYDTMNLKFVYICNVCGEQWRSRA